MAHAVALHHSGWAVGGLPTANEQLTICTVRQDTTLRVSRIEKLLRAKENSVMETRVERGQAREDQITGAIENVTARAPSSLFLGIAIGAMAASAILKILEKDDWALFVGQWAAPLLIMGTYNKMVKQHGSDASVRNLHAT
jgi:hypothetical protein